MTPIEHLPLISGRPAPEHGPAPTQTADAGDITGAVAGAADRVAQRAAADIRHGNRAAFGGATSVVPVAVTDDEARRKLQRPSAPLRSCNSSVWHGKVQNQSAESKERCPRWRLEMLRSHAVMPKLHGPSIHHAGVSDQVNDLNRPSSSIPAEDKKLRVNRRARNCGVPRPNGCVGLELALRCPGTTIVSRPDVILPGIPRARIRANRPAPSLSARLLGFDLVQWYSLKLMERWKSPSGAGTVIFFHRQTALRRHGFLAGKRSAWGSHCKITARQVP